MAQSGARPNLVTSGGRSAPVWEADDEFVGGDGDGQGSNTNIDTAVKAGAGARGPDGVDGSTVVDKAGKE